MNRASYDMVLYLSKAVLACCVDGVECWAVIRRDLRHYWHVAELLTESGVCVGVICRHALPATILLCRHDVNLYAIVSGRVML